MSFDFILKNVSPSCTLITSKLSYPYIEDINSTEGYFITESQSIDSVRNRGVLFQDWPSKKKQPFFARSENSQLFFFYSFFFNGTLRLFPWPWKESVILYLYLFSKLFQWTIWFFFCIAFILSLQQLSVSQERSD